MTRSRRHSPPTPSAASSLVGLAVLGLALMSCAQDGSTAPGEPLLSREARPAVSQGEAQTYAAQLRPLNGAFSYRPVQGIANFKIKDGVLTVRVNASGLQPGMPHAQHVHMASGCPSPGDDGGDGIVSLGDGVPFFGPVLFWLDGDLATPGPDPTTLPNPDNAGGAITFMASGSVADLEAALGGPLDLANRTVVLHGVAAGTDLSADPAAAAAPAGLPVACGVVN
ncbi:MAG: superoxide dismutase family protein [Gemmatimonadota bacterium]|nr:superoxide dismutase family protein [Gemmatimonadota bacterium]